MSGEDRRLVEAVERLAAAVEAANARPVEVLDVPALAELLGLSVRTVWRRIADGAGELPPGRRVGEAWRWSRAAVLAWLAAPEGLQATNAPAPVLTLPPAPRGRQRAAGAVPTARRGGGRQGLALTPAQVARIVELGRAGVEVAAICAEVGCSDATARRKLREAGIR